MTFHDWSCLLPSLITNIIAVILNVVAIGCLHRRLIEWPSTRIFLLSLSYADLLVSLFNAIWITLFAATNLVGDDEVWNLFVGLNITIILFAIISGIASVWLITIDRLICVIRPVMYRSTASPSWAKRLTIVAWIISSLVTLFLVALTIFFNKPVYLRHSLATGLLLTCICMVAAYGVIVRTVRKTNRSTRDPASSNTLTGTQRLRIERKEKKERQLIWLCVTIVLSFVCCTSPYIIQSFLQATIFSREDLCSSKHTFRRTAFTLLYLNMLLDPCVYLFFRLPPFKSVRNFICRKRRRTTSRTTINRGSLHRIDEENESFAEID